MPVNISSKGVSIYLQSRTEQTSEIIKRLARRIRCLSRRHLAIHSEYNRLRDPIISKAYSTMSVPRNQDDAQQCSIGSKRHFLT